MKYTMLLMILFPIVVFSSCKKEDLTDIIDITQFSWKLKSITIDENKIKVKAGDYFNSEAYILVFENDSIFRLNTSVNLSKGGFKIDEKGNINILYYQEITEVGGQNEIDNDLLQNISSITSYQVLNNILILKGGNFEMELEKK